MDVAGVTIIPDSWLSKAMDAAVVVMGAALKFSHAKSERQADEIRSLRNEHEVFKSKLEDMSKDITEIKDDGKEMRGDIKLLLQRGGKDWRH